MVQKFYYTNANNVDHVFYGVNWEKIREMVAHPKTLAWIGLVWFGGCEVRQDLSLLKCIYAIQENKTILGITYSVVVCTPLLKGDDTCNLMLNFSMVSDGERIYFWVIVQSVSWTHLF